MTAHTWRFSQSVQARDLERDASLPVVAGLLNTPDGGVQVALQVGDDSRPVILTTQDARQLSHYLIESIVERLVITAENLPEDDQERGESQP